MSAARKPWKTPDILRRVHAQNTCYINGLIVGGEGVLPRPAKILFTSDYSLRTALPAHTSAHPGTVDLSGRVWIGPVQEMADVSKREGALTNSGRFAECLLSEVQKTLLHAARNVC
jgi:hypothetical protein